MSEAQTQATGSQMDQLKPSLGLFQAYGIEIEYMVVDRDTMQIRSVVDEVFKVAVGRYASDYEDGIISWSNELVSHVIELKGTGPVPTLKDLEFEFHRSLQVINQILAKMNACLMPSAMHPWMNPMTETKLWAHDNNEVYDAYHRIFDCRGHGWSNLQSMHINLPFKNDQEFGELHTAVRCLLPILPALSASSPVMDGIPTDFHDNRLRVYQTNQKRVPSIAGLVIPEPVTTASQYRKEIFEVIFKEIAPHDPEEMMREEWLNSRGAIARFDRNAIEIRVLDCQECPKMDIAIADFISSTLKMLMKNHSRELSDSRAIPTANLKAIFDLVAKDAETAMLAGNSSLDDNHSKYLKCLGIQKISEIKTAKDIWMHFFSQSEVKNEMSTEHLQSIDYLLKHGTLASRIQARLLEAGQTLQEAPELPDKVYGPPGSHFDEALQPKKSKIASRQETPPALLEIYRELCSCLNENRFFT